MGLKAVDELIGFRADGSFVDIVKEKRLHSWSLTMQQFFGRGGFAADDRLDHDGTDTKQD